MKAAVEWFALFKSLSPHLALALEWLLKTSFLFGIALLVATLLRNRSARARCWIWRLFFATLAVLLFAEWSPRVVDRFRPRVAVSPDAAVRTDFQHQAETFWILRPQQERDELRSRRQTEFLEAMPEGRPPWETTPFFQTMDDFRTAWLNRLEKAIPWIGGLGAAWALLVLALRSFLGLRWLRKGAMPAGKTIVEAAREVCIQLHVRRTPEIRVSSKLATPLLSGFFRPVIHLPAMTAEWERSKLLDVLFHELAHWKRHDFLWLQAGRVLTALFWWNPCLRHALRRMNEAAEEAADDQVLLSRRPADAYARTLVEIAAGANLSGKAAGLPMIGHRSLERRIKSLMAENRWRGKLGKQAIVMIAATFLIGSLAASVRIGMASPALRAAPSAPALLTPKQRELAERIIASTKKRMEAFRCTHVKLESRFVEEEGAKRIISPMPAQMEAWWDSWTSRYRVQYTPRVVRWLHGASDFSISDETTVFDGRSVYNWKEGRPMTENPVSPDRLLHPDYLNLHDGSYLIQMLSMVLHYGSLQPGVVEYAITETQWEGEEAVKIVETFTSDDKIQQQRTIVVTAGENDLIRFSETLFPHGNFTRKTINQVAKAANGEFYATHYTTASSIRKTITTTQYTVLSLEPLAELPAAVFHLPTTRPVTAISEKPYVQPEAIALQCLESETGMPIPDVKLRVVINKKKSTLVTDREGRATLSLPGEEITYLTVQTRKAGHAPRLLRWYKEADPLQIPATYSIKLPKGSPIFGSVVNEAGEGIAGASVRFHLSGTSQIWGAFMDGYDLTGKLATTETDAEGRWRLADFPLELKNLFFRISAPGYQATTDSGIGDFRNSTGLPYTALRDGTAVVTLQRGHQLHGTITDRKGQPIADCRVVLGRDIHGSNPPTTRTNAAGEYVLQGLRSESTWITVESPLHQPVAKEITLPIVGTLDFALEPGRVIRGRVTLPDGKPSAGLNVHVDGWNQLRTLDFSTKTDAEGRFIWRGAPKEPVGFVFGTGQSREFLSDLPLSASDKVQTVVIKPALRFKGKVFDDETGKPIQRFILLHGDATYGNATWNHESSQTCKEGQFDWSTTRFGRRYMFRFEAPGYEPFVSGPLESRQNVETATIRLKRQ